MRKETFRTIARMIEDDPLTEAQIRQLSGADKDEVVTSDQAAAMLGVTVKHLYTIKDLPRIRINGRVCRYRLVDVRRYRDARTY